jgi:hypothetical protein
MPYGFLFLAEISLGTAIGFLALVGVEIASPGAPFRTLSG